jgi:hypothetical protein
VACYAVTLIRFFGTHFNIKSLRPVGGNNYAVTMHDSLLTQSVCGGSPISLSLAVSIAMRISASALVRFGLNASGS